VTPGAAKELEAALENDPREFEIHRSCWDGISVTEYLIFEKSLGYFKQSQASSGIGPEGWDSVSRSPVSFTPNHRKGGMQQ